MSPNLRPRPAFLVIASAVLLSSTACGGSQDKPTVSSPGPASTTVTRHAGGHDRAGGLISAVSGHTVQVTTPDGGTADIDFNTMTKLTEVRPGELADVVVGSCVSVLSAPGADTDDVTAQRVLISAAEDNKCAADTPPGGAPPPGIPQTPPLPGPEGPPPGAPAPFGGPNVQGGVASVNGNTIVVTNTNPSAGSAIQTNVTVNDDTKYDKRQPTEAIAITTGKCADARGTNDAQGVLQATKIDLGPAVDERCGPPLR